MLRITGIGTMSFDCKFDGFGVPCDICGKENACHRLSGDMPPGIPGTYCDDCHKIVCKKASQYYKKQIKEGTKNLKSTVIFREGGTWSQEEVYSLLRLTNSDVWESGKHPEYLIIEGHHSDKKISKALVGKNDYMVRRVIGNNKKELPFLPI